MIKIYIEYKVGEGDMAAYEALIPELKRAWQEFGAVQVGFFKAADQPFLFVEEGLVDGLSEYEAFKRLRTLGAHSPWNRLNALIPGGKERQHIWAFEPLT